MSPTKEHARALPLSHTHMFYINNELRLVEARAARGSERAGRIRGLLTWGGGGDGRGVGGGGCRVSGSGVV